MAAMYGLAVGPRSNFAHTYHRSSFNAKRKSAVELLQETKPLYVKSEIVLDNTQTLGLTNQESSRSQSSSCQRRSQQNSEQLETKLRRLLNGSRENLNCSSQENEKQVKTSCKSLPDLSLGQKEISLFVRSGSCRLASTSSSRLTDSKNSREAVTCSTSRLGYDGGSASSNSDSISEDSSEKSYGRPPSDLLSSSVSLGGSASKLMTRFRMFFLQSSKTDKTAVPRSKSYGGLFALTTSETIPSDLDDFFQHLGLDFAQYKSLMDSASRESSPIFFPSCSSRDSGRAAPGRQSAETLPSAGPSIVERNARIIKWLVQCGRA